MKIYQIREVLNTEEYNFLREDVNIRENLMFLTLGGSHAYGTNNDNSDIDIRGIMLNNYKEILTMKCKDKPYEKKDDTKDVVIYPLKQIIPLLINCNPNVLEILGVREEQIFVMTPEGKLLKDNLDIFLSKRAFASFSGYAMQQLRRLENALARNSYGQVEKERHILKSIESKLMDFEYKYLKITSNNIKLSIDKSEKEDMEEEIYIDLKLEHYPLRDLKMMYDDMSQIIREFGKLNHRNNKKEENQLYKHAMHLIRLLTMGIEVAEGKGVQTFREKDRDFLLDIRNGRYSFEEIFEKANELDNRLKYTMKYSSLPDNPDYEKIDEIVMEINKNVLRRNTRGR